MLRTIGWNNYNFNDINRNIIMIPKLRQCQQHVMNILPSCTTNRIAVNSPTGSGKAVLLMAIAQQQLSLGKRVLILVDRIALVNQLSVTALQCGIEHNIIYGSKKHYNVTKQTTIASIQSWFKFNKNNNLTFDIVLHDECHTLYDSFSKFMTTNPGQLIGVSATCFTPGLDTMYKEIINAATMHELTTLGILAPLKCYTFTKINMQGAKILAGEWTSTEVRNRCADILGDVVLNYQIAASGKRAIAFCANVAHCEDVAAQFRAKNIPVAVYTSRNTEKERLGMLADFDNKIIMVLISVACLSKGFDKPFIECILDLRPLRRSFAEYVQMLGRGNRSMPGKSHCLVLDFSGNMQRFIEDYEHLYYHGVESFSTIAKLNRPRAADSLSKSCPECNKAPFSTRCVNCGYEAVSTRVITTDVEDVRPVEIKVREFFENYTYPGYNQPKKRSRDILTKLFTGK